MTDNAKKYLSDILQAIELIEAFTNEIDTFQDYLHDLKTKSAVERQLGIIGEAVNKFEQLEEGFQLSNSRQIVGFRNRLIHAYDNIDDTIVWAILQKYLPTLKTEVQSGLAK